MGAPRRFAQITPWQLSASFLMLPALAWFVTACALQHRAIGDSAMPDVVGFDGDSTVPIDGDADADADADAAPDVDSGCPSGTQLCNGTCVAVDTPQRCGSCTNDCTALDGVSATGVQCVAGACAIDACQPDRGDCDHIVSNGCETSLADATNCGACGTVCTSTTPVCVRDSMTGTIACAGGCPPGQTRCPSGACSDTATDIANCGACAMACAAPTGAMAMCAAGMCSWSCNPGSHMCGGSCVADTSTDGCGTSCTPCPTDPNGTATCASGTCGLTCNAGYHLCGSVCVSSASTATCGTSCMPCAEPIGTVATCTGGTCGTMCATGYHMCSGLCVSDASPMSCGTSCTPCPSGTNATATCTAGVCGTMCAAGYALSGTSCVLATCNNRMLDAGEQCDDGNNATGDGCDANCQLEAGAVVAGCPTSAGVQITRRGTYVFSGNTTGLANSTGSCSANGPEQGISATVNVTGSFTVTVTAQPVTSGYDIVFKHGGSCGGLTCEDANGAGGSESYNITFTTPPLGPFYWVVDGRGGTNAGAWRLVVTVM